MEPGDGLDLMFNSYRVNPWEVWEGQHRWRVSIGLTASRQKRLFFYRQPSKMQIDINCPKISSHFSLTFFSISADHHGLLAPEESSSTLANQFPCMFSKNTPSRLYKTLEIAYI